MADSQNKIELVMKRSVYDAVIPTYLLDDTFRFILWNPAFDEIIAKKFDLSLGNHASRFVDVLENGEASLARAAQVFGMGEIPKVDHEVLLLKTEKYGMIHFEKLAVYYDFLENLDNFWMVSFNINQCASMDLLFDDLLSIKLKNPLSLS